VITTSNEAGRLATVRIASPVTLEEIGELGKELKRLIVVHGRIVIAGDLLQCLVFPQDRYDAFVAMLKSDNPAIERSALLMASGATFALQLERMIKDAGSPRRRTFRDPRELCEWLAESLEPAERAVLDRFFAAQP
jgi:hypothetical protein